MEISKVRRRIIAPKMTGEGANRRVSVEARIIEKRDRRSILFVGKKGLGGRPVFMERGVE